MYSVYTVCITHNVYLCEGIRKVNMYFVMLQYFLKQLLG